MITASVELNSVAPETEQIPLTVLTGFLGAGKTTLLNGLLRDPGLSDVAVLVNEVGDVGIDHLFYEILDENVLLLASGCLCCAVRGDLVEALLRLAGMQKDGRARSFSRVVIETTGLADPAPVLHVTMTHPELLQRFRLDGVITVVDAVNAASTLDEHAEAVKQAAMADRIVLTKADLVRDLDGYAALRRRLARLNPAAPQLDARKGEATPERLFGGGLFGREATSKRLSDWLAHTAVAESEQEHRHADGEPHRHDAHVRVFTLTSSDPMPLATLELFLDLVRSAHGPKLLRLKGIVNVAESPESPAVLHVVQHLMHPVVRLPEWPDADRRSRLVCITRDLDPSVVRGLFSAFVGTPQIDRPDRAAITDNPLALPG